MVLLPGAVLDRLVYGLGGHRPGDLATVIFSSGSTGDPKGVMLTHGNVAANCESVIQASDPASDRLLGVLPFFHSFGYTVTLWVPLQVGATVVTIPIRGRRRRSASCAGSIAARCTSPRPRFLRFCLRKSEPGDFSDRAPAGLRGREAAASRWPTNSRRNSASCRWKATAAPSSRRSSRSTSRTGSTGRCAMGNKAGTIGPPVPGVAAKIVDPRNVRAAAGTARKAAARPRRQRDEGLLGRTRLPAKVIRDGWYVTGDMAVDRRRRLHHDHGPAVALRQDRRRDGAAPEN